MKSLFRTLLLATLTLFAALPSFAAAPVQGTMVRVHTTLGPIDFKLLDTAAPVSVANFLGYVGRGDYTDVFFHRSAGLSVPANISIIQAGGFKWPAGSTWGVVPQQPPIVNESSPDRSNVRGTVAMARTSDPNSATSQWYINVLDNTFLDSPPGYAVFAHVTPQGMLVADKIAALAKYKVNNTPFTDIPLTQATFDRPYTVRLLGANELTAATTAQRVFNYLEAAYPQTLPSQPTASGEYAGYNYRYYASLNLYLVSKDGNLGYYLPSVSQAVGSLGTEAFWLGIAEPAGY